MAKDSNNQSYDLSDFSNIIRLLQTKKNDIRFIEKTIVSHLNLIIKNSNLGENYNIIFLHDDKRQISSLHSDNIYRSLNEKKEKKDILLITQSNGGKIEPAYFISKICNRLKKNKFVVAIPRRAKSAATLIALGADEVHMGLMSELGPIDPQINGLPALSISNALEKIAKVAEKHPGSSDMFSMYLQQHLSLSVLGYLERVNESAIQYATRLLDGKKFPRDQSANDLSHHFTNHYKDHSFVIDFDEAKNLLGDEIVKQDTEEYKLANELYQFLNLLEFTSVHFLKRNIVVVGSGEYCVNLNKIQNDDSEI